MPFSTLATLPGRTLFPGVIGRYAHTDRFTVGHVEMLPDSAVPTHQHPHEQLSYVVSGQIEFTVGAEIRVMNPGMCALIPGNVPHSVRAITQAHVIDTFTPVREDYR